MGLGGPSSDQPPSLLYSVPLLPLLPLWKRVRPDAEEVSPGFPHQPLRGPQTPTQPWPSAGLLPNADPTFRASPCPLPEAPSSPPPPTAPLSPLSPLPSAAHLGASWLRLPCSLLSQGLELDTAGRPAPGFEWGSRLAGGLQGSLLPPSLSVPRCEVHRTGLEDTSPGASHMGVRGPRVRTGISLGNEGASVAAALLTSV